MDDTGFPSQEFDKNANILPKIEILAKKYAQNQLNLNNVSKNEVVSTKNCHPKSRMVSTSKLYGSIHEIPDEILTKISRVGIIPIYYQTMFEMGEAKFNHDKDPYFAIAVDAKSGQATDCGGMRYPHESISETALRELLEESIGIFGELSKDEIENHSMIIADARTCIFLFNITHKLTPFILKNLSPEFIARRNIAEDALANLIKRKAPVFEQKKLGCFLENTVMFWIRFSDLVQVLKCRPNRKKSKTSPTKQLPILLEELSSPLSLVENKRCIRIHKSPIAVPDESIFSEKNYGMGVYPMCYERVRRLIKPIIAHKSFIDKLMIYCCQ